ncbi:MAG: O-antigen ligase family protein [Phycisphaerales bacterium]|nr:O-antigen ligase family protein [Phycisphaerales bacterium]
MNLILRRIPLLILLVVVGLRPLIGETYDAAQDVISSGVSQLAPAMPMRTLAIDVAILAAAVGVIARRAWTRSYRRTGLEWGFALLVVAAGVSCAWAQQKRLAVNASIDWLCLPVLAMALVQEVTTHRHRRVLLGVIVASAAANAVECLDEAWLSLPETRRFYEENRTQFWRERGVPLDSAMVRMYEARLRAGEPDGFFYHGNVAGGYLAMVALALAGAVAAGRSRILGAGAVALLALAMFLTGSTGALAAFALAGGAWVGASVLRRWPQWRELIARRRRAVFLGAWSCVAFSAAAVVGHGLYHKSLPGASLNFRWQYWTASVEMIRDHLWTGVGRENFGRHYVRYKSIESPEEVASPHNLLVQAAADFGVVGLAGLMALLIGGSAWLAGVAGPGGGRADDGGRAGCGGCASGTAATRDPPPVEALKNSPSRRTVLIQSLLLALVIFGIRLPLLGADSGAFMLVQSYVALPVWIAAFLLIALPGASAEKIPTTRRNTGECAAMEPRPAAALFMFAGACAGLAAFVIQDAVNFALFVPASATTALALYAFAASSRHARTAPAAPSSPAGGQARPAHTTPLTRGTFLLLTPAILILLGCTAWQTWVVARSNRALAEARELARRCVPGAEVVQDAPRRNGVEDAVRHVLERFSDAARMDAWDPTPCLEQGEWLAALCTRGALPASPQGFDQVRAALDQARRRDPARAEISRRIARTELAAASRLAAESTKPRTQQAEHLIRAVEAAQRVVQLYPSDPSAWRLLGECQMQAGDASSDPEAWKAAEASLSRSLDLDAARPAWEVIRRFSDAERGAIERLREAVQGELSGVPKPSPGGPDGG